MPAESPRIPEPPFTLRPELGLLKFRRNASLRVEDDAIVATDRRGRCRRFPRDGTDQAPAEVRSFGLDKKGLVDGNGKLLALWDSESWDGEDLANFFLAANLSWVIYEDPTLPPMRADGLKIFDIPALLMLSAFSSIGIAAFAASQLHVIPDVVTVPIMIVALAACLVSFVLWRRTQRLEPEVAERVRKEMRDAVAEARSRGEEPASGVGAPGATDRNEGRVHQPDPPEACEPDGSGRG